MDPAANDNPPPTAPRFVPVIGFVAGDGHVTITDPAWRPSPRPAEADAWPNDPREA